MKALKVIGKILLWTLVVVVVALLALPLWIGPVVKGVANSVVPGKTGTGFHLGEFGLNPYVGTLHVGDMQLENPKGFSEKNAVALDKFAADLAVTSLFGGKKYRVESIELDGLTIYSDTAGSNFRQIAAAATSGCRSDSGNVRSAARTRLSARYRGRSTRCSFSSSSAVSTQLASQYLQISPPVAASSRLRNSSVVNLPAQ